MKLAINKEALDLIKYYEGFRAKPYFCEADYLTIGYGHRILPSEKFKEISRSEAENLLILDVQIAARAVDRLVDVPLNENQFGALVSFVYNIGVNAFKDSTMLKKLNDSHYKDASNQFGRWIYVKKQVSSGLVKRREAEKLLFLKEVISHEKEKR